MGLCLSRQVQRFEDGLHGLDQGACDRFAMMREGACEVDLEER